MVLPEFQGAGPWTGVLCAEGPSTHSTEVDVTFADRVLRSNHWAITSRTDRAGH